VALQRHIALHGLLHVLAAVEPVGLEHIGDAAIEPLHHAIGFRCPWPGQPAPDAQSLTQRIGLVVAAGLAFFAGKPQADPDTSSAY
jgi:hypothetical protein